MATRGEGKIVIDDKIEMPSVKEVPVMA